MVKRGRPKKHVASQAEPASQHGTDELNLTNFSVNVSDIGSTDTVVAQWSPAQQASFGRDDQPSQQEIRTLLSSISDLPLDISLAASLIDGTLSLGYDLGLLDPFLANRSDQFEDENDRILALPEITILCLLSLSLELHWTLLSEGIQQEIELVQSSLRNRILAAIPPITWQCCHASPQHAGALMMLSHTWCFTKGLGSFAAQWNDMSNLLAQISENLQGQGTYKAAYS